MGLLTTAKSLFSGFLAGPGKLPPVALPKAPTRQQSIDSFRKQAAKSTSALQRDDKNLASTDILTFRNGVTDTRKVIRDLAYANPDLAATVNSYLRVAIPDTYTIVARDMDGSINVESTQMAQELVRRLTFLGDVALGYNPYSDLNSISESLALEGLLYGSMAAELVLDSQRLPTYIQPVSVTTIKFKEDSKAGVYPVQEVGGEEVKLDLPTFFYLAIDQNLLSAYSSGFLDSAIQAVLADSKFLNDVRNSLQRALQPRLVATVIEDKVKASVPPEILNDPAKLAEFYTNLITQLTDLLQNLEPEDALISLDSIKFGTLENSSGSGSRGSAETLNIIQELLNSKLASGAKTMPAILGRDASGTAATASSMLFLKSANVLRSKLNTLYSRVLTQGLRILGQDVYVEFSYADIDLRPKTELEAYKAMEMSRVTKLLSLGFITDEEACIRLTGNLPPVGHKPLSGTMFDMGSTQIIENPDSQTSTIGKDKPVQPKD